MLFSASRTVSNDPLLLQNNCYCVKYQRVVFFALYRNNLVLNRVRAKLSLKLSIFSCNSIIKPFQDYFLIHKTFVETFFTHTVFTLWMSPFYLVIFLLHFDLYIKDMGTYGKLYIKKDSI